MAEEWKDIVGYGGQYQVSNRGRVKSFKVHAHGFLLTLVTTSRGYIVVTLHGPIGQRTVKVHQLVAAHFVPNPEGADIVDHIDGNPKNNDSSNLRWVSPTQNRHNSAPRRGTSIYKGVSFCKRMKKWKAGIELNGIKRHLGYFVEEADAAIAFNRAAGELHGAYARLNVIPDQDPAVA